METHLGIPSQINFGDSPEIQNRTSYQQTAHCGMEVLPRSGEKKSLATIARKN